MATKATLDELVRQINAGTLKAPSNTTAVRSGGRGSVTNKTTTKKSGTSGAAKSTAPTVRDSTGTLAKASGVPKKAADTTSTAYYTQQRQSADRLYNMLASAAKERASAAPQVAGSVVEGAGRLNKALEDKRSKDLAEAEAESTRRYRAQLNSGKNEKGQPLTEEERFRLNTLIKRNEKMKTVREQGAEQTLSNTLKTADKAYQAADKLKASAEKSQAEAKKGLGKAGSFAVDLGTAGVQMLGDVALSTALPGAGLTAMGVRSGAGAAQTARKEGASYGQQVAYGLGSGALSVATEKLSNVAAPFKKAFGEGVLDKAISKAVDRLNGSTIGKAALSFLSEGGEEMVEDLVQPILQKATYQKDALSQYGDADYWANTLYDGLVGGTLGLVGSGVENLQARQRARADVETAAPAQADVQQGTDTPQAQDAAQRAAEGTENAAPNAETARNENGLNAFTEQERINLSSGKKNKIISTFNDAVDFVRNALSNKQNVDRAYLGKVPDRVAQQVLRDTGIDISGLSAMINGNDVRHIIKDHGDPIAETARGQVSVTPKDIALVSEILSSPDHVSLSTESDSKGRTALIFEKQYGDKYITVQGVSDGKHVLQTDTLYIRKGRTRSAQDTMLSTQTDAAPVINARSELPQGSSNLDTTIAQGAEVVKNGDSADRLLEILRGKKRVNQEMLSDRQFMQAADAGASIDADGKVYLPDAAQHIDNRTRDSVASRDVHAFQFDNPEVHGFYREAAQALLEDLDLSVDRGSAQAMQRTVDGKRYTNQIFETPSIRAAMDETGVSRTAIMDAAQRLITDHGQENVAAAKRLELVLDDMLSNGYTRLDGSYIPANQAYIDAKNAIVGAQLQQKSGGYLDGLDGLGNADAGTVNTPFDRMQAQSDAFHPVNPNSAQRIMAEQNRAPSEVPTVNPETGRNVEKTVSTILNSPLTSPEMATVYENAIAGGAFDYDVVTDRDAVQRAAAWDSIITDIASQMPSTFREKADFWRYTSMLTNPTTHIRNMAGNLLQMGARKIKNAVGTGRMPKLYALQSENL